MILDKRIYDKIVHNLSHKFCAAFIEFWQINYLTKICGTLINEYLQIYFMTYITMFLY